MVEMKRLVGLLLVLFAVSGCAVQYDNVTIAPDGSPRLQTLTPKMKQRIDELAQALIALDPAIIDTREAKSVAHDAFVYPMYLANDWGLTWPPVFHNTLRNSKQRKAGLCVDWARAMRARMRTKDLKTFDLYWGVAYKGNPWREHSTLIVTAKGKPFATGILLDPWRNSGDLYWSTIKDDLQYPWKYFEGPG
ncbi:hypothetical protein HMY34_16535 [Thiothrix subterranea]|uniref:hypothetical protein n=1 Tax=Thiothrix subterranea TaxID=2735563 RepID=UPI00192B6BFA|nr:hypothetical protein [Thiothrix subterranea]QQZ30236.1 hypothetical protein HMY34_16535 [Thiothrix subterranea]